VKIRRRARPTAWLSATAVAAAAVLTVATNPASADDVGILALQQVSGVAEGGIDLPYNAPGTPLLGHFFYRYLNEDNHLKTMAAFPSPPSGTGVIAIAFADSFPDDDYEYRIGHQRVSPTGLSPGRLTDRCRGQCTRSIARPSGDVVFVITGFNFGYTDDDHHMDAIGIIENNGQLTHWFNDQNDDDEYRVTLDYFWVPRSRFSSVTSVSGTVHAAGNVTRSVPAGEKVIRGFHVNNVNSGGSGDNHIKEFGFLTNSDTVDIFYGDKNPADSADWTYQLNYAILR
jgi:hypothetical protein